MKTSMSFASIALLLFVAMCSVTAQESADAQQGMPPMGQPEEMKGIQFLEGTWDAVMKYRMEPTSTEWMESKGTAIYSMILDGCALQMEYDSEFMGMPFKGLMLQVYDRESSKWQSVWIDNMAARASMYDGYFANDTSVMQGIDRYQGQDVHTRIKTFNHTDTSFTWQMENSSDGEHYFIVGTAEYTKRD